MRKRIGVDDKESSIEKIIRKVVAELEDMHQSEASAVAQHLGTMRDMVKDCATPHEFRNLLHSSCAEFNSSVDYLKRRFEEEFRQAYTAGGHVRPTKSNAPGRER